MRFLILIHISSFYLLIKAENYLLKIRLPQFDDCKVEPEGTSALAAGSRVLFLETVRRSNAACQNGDYALAATLYTEALALDPLSHVLYSNRSAARLKMGLFALALQDAVRATELSPQWPKVCILRHIFLSISEL